MLLEKRFRVGPSGYRAVVLYLNGPRFGYLNNNCFGERPIPSKLALCVYVPETDIYALHSSLTKHSKPTKSQLEQFKLNKNIYKQKSTYFLRPKTKLTSQITMTESKPEKQNFHWNTYKMWNNRILGETHFRKKAFRRIYNATNNIRAELQLRDVDQTCFEETSDPLSIEGIVYAIIHIPSGKIYVGQTIVGAFKRFQQNWYSRKERKGKSSKSHYGKAKCPKLPNLAT